MAAKKVQVEVKLASGFKTECRAGKHTVIIDQPQQAGGTDAGPTPLEIQLMALGGCLTAVGRIVASQRKLTIRGMEVVLEGEIDTDVLLGRRTGFTGISARMKIDADMSPAEKESFLKDVEARCPISENLRNATPVHVVVEG